MERTLLIIKPDAVSKRVAGNILHRVAQEGFRLCALRSERLTPETAGEFYRVHQDKPFYQSLVEFMASGPILLAVLEKENAVRDLRSLVGATDPQDAQEGTIRKEFAEDGSRNAVHASDSLDTAREEITFFFSDTEFG